MIRTFLVYLKKSYYQEPHEDIWWCEAIMLITVLPILACIVAASVRKILGKSI